MLAGLHVDHCPQCGRVYQKNIRNMCSDCTVEFDKGLKACIDALYRNRKLTTKELSDASGIDTKRIEQYVYERRLFVHDYPNLTYPCNLCGSPIRTEKLCTSCRVDLINDIDRMHQSDRELAERRRAQHAFKIKE